MSVHVKENPNPSEATAYFIHPDKYFLAGYDPLKTRPKDLIRTLGFCFALLPYQELRRKTMYLP